MTWDTASYFEPFKAPVSANVGNDFGRFAGLNLMGAALKNQQWFDPGDIYASHAINDANVFGAVTKAEAELEVAKNRQESVAKYIAEQKAAQAKETETNNWINAGITAAKIGAAFIPGVGPAISTGLNMIG